MAARIIDLSPLFFFALTLACLHVTALKEENANQAKKSMSKLFVRLG